MTAKGIIHFFLSISFNVQDNVLIILSGDELLVNQYH